MEEKNCAKNQGSDYTPALGKETCHAVKLLSYKSCYNTIASSDQASSFPAEIQEVASWHDNPTAVVDETAFTTILERSEDPRLCKDSHLQIKVPIEARMFTESQGSDKAPECGTKASLAVKVLSSKIGYNSAASSDQALSLSAEVLQVAWWIDSPSESVEGHILSKMRECSEDPKLC